MSNKIIALNPRYQVGLDFYQKRDFRGVYLGASDRVKRYYEIIFYRGSPTARHDTEEQRRQGSKDLIAVYKNLTDDDWQYIIGHTHWGMARWGLSKAQAQYGRNGSTL